MLIKEHGHPYPGFYGLHKMTIHANFHPNSFSIELARTLHAPVEQSHESLQHLLAHPDECVIPPDTDQKDDDDDE
jgi:hypothetical protein